MNSCFLWYFHGLICTLLSYCLLMGSFVHCWYLKEQITPVKMYFRDLRVFYGVTCTLHYFSWFHLHPSRDCRVCVTQFRVRMGHNNPKHHFPRFSILFWCLPTICLFNVPISRITSSSRFKVVAFFHVQHLRIIG
jgi:hypothetical protein